MEFSEHDHHDDDKCKVCKVTQTSKVRPPKRFINYDQYIDKAIHVASQIPGGNQQSDENQQFRHYCTIQKVKQDWKEFFLRFKVKIVSFDKASLIANILGKDQHSVIYEDCRTLSKQYKSLDTLNSLNIYERLNNRNPVVREFIKGIAHISDDELQSMEPSKLYVLGRAVEQLYKLRMPKLICSLSFLTTLNIYKITGSRLAINIVSASSPGGGYTSILKWL